MLKFALVILDGFGLRLESEGNAFRLAHTPTLDHLLNKYPMIPLETSGRAVGLPEGVMGNSEVGHMNIGAGRIVRQDLVRINDEVDSGAFQRNPVLLEQMHQVVARGSAFHVMGLCSDAGVHSHLNHLRAILETAKSEGLSRVQYHACMDGRDTSPLAGRGYLKQVQGWMNELGVGAIATVVGRYYIMDRDKRWDRIEKAYRLLVHGEGETYATAIAAIEASYAGDVGDEFVTPRIIGTASPIRSGDALLAMNFRADRMRQIISAFIEPDFAQFPVNSLQVDVRSMTQYDESFTIPVLFSPENLTNIFPEILSRAGYRQLRVAETEKYAHVTYFFNGGDEKTFPGEVRILIPSPKVATYDLQPSMSAEEVTDRAVEAIAGGNYEAIIVNFANPDMVGHTGDLEAAIAAMETIDRCVSRLLKAMQGLNAALFLTSDHGNVETMIDLETGRPHTAHTTRSAPFILVAPSDDLRLEGSGKLADIAPTILTYLDLDIPPEMTGTNRLVRVPANAT
ncbi:MAG: 2,3-bisphosphoglycerate-independent phosphoglycerate mutase [Candidatus Neomarinimicrobiota bacterium]